MIHFKACPRCVGDLELRHEYGEWIVRCVQCGWEYAKPTPDPDQLEPMQHRIRNDGQQNQRAEHHREGQ